jgi:hypothetical protein
VQLVASGVQLVATRDISPGEQLLLPVEQLFFGQTAVVLP